MKKLVLVLFFFWVFFSFPSPSFATTDPLSTPNNKFGIHILFPSEIRLASTLVNTSGGDWGYVTIPIQSGDKNIVKWQKFMNDCRQYHLIPIIRLATEGDYFNTKVWRKPNYLDIIDFANFLSSLSWPTKNKYVIVYNEVNRGDEWGGIPNPGEYAQILSFAVTIFKSRSDNFFIISAGLDNASVNTVDSMNEYAFLRGMNTEIPGIFSQIDGLGSHSYPNPAFLQPPTRINSQTIGSFRFEKNLVGILSKKQLPVFITETGWTRNGLSETTIANYFTAAFQYVWNDPNVVAVTPFLLEAGGQFADFSIFTPTGFDTTISKAIKAFPKIKGQPALENVLSAETIFEAKKLPIKNFSKNPEKVPQKLPNDEFRSTINDLAKYLLHI